MQSVFFLHISRLKKNILSSPFFLSVFCRQVREQDISVDGTCLNGECRNTGAGECFCVGFRSSIGDEADFSGCRGCMNGRIGKVVREMEFHGTVDGFCCQVLGTGSLEEDFTVDTV